MKSIIRSFRLNRVNVVLLLVFILVLLSLPQLTALFVPCLKNIPGSSYNFNECNLDLAFNYYLGMALITLAASILLSFFLRSTKKLMPLLVTAIIFTGLTIVAFHLYIPQAEGQVNRAAIILDEDSFKP